MEEDRVEFIKGNVWEYANLASAKLLIQDEVSLYVFLITIPSLKQI